MTPLVFFIFCVIF